MEEIASFKTNIYICVIAARVIQLFFHFYIGPRSIALPSICVSLCNFVQDKMLSVYATINDRCDRPMNANVRDRQRCHLNQEYKTVHDVRCPVVLLNRFKPSSEIFY